MWEKKYRDYPPGASLKKCKLETGKGLVGCEMNEPFGWEGNTLGSSSKTGTLAYHRCPDCGFIFENRDPFTYALGNWEKNLTCPKCSTSFTLKKRAAPPIGPLFGEPPKPEFDWS